MTMDFREELGRELEGLRGQGLYRTLREVSSEQGRRIIVEGRECVSFGSNNYLGLANREELRRAAIDAIQRFGCSAAASRLISGTMSPHVELEKKIAEFEECEDAIVFATGYMANVGAISVLVGPKDTVIIDKLCHASIIDGCQLSGARLRVYPHRDLEKLERVLAHSVSFRRRLIVTDGVFSMDGDLAPLPAIVELGERYEAVTMVDEAHGTGVIGPTGRGAVEHFGLKGQVDVLMGTLSKAVGSQGGFVAGGRELIDLLRNRARPFVYTTAPPPGDCAAALAGLEIIEGEPELRQRLWDNAAAARRAVAEAGFQIAATETPIIPIIVGEADRAVELANFLFERGLYAPAVRPPTVPKGQSRIRVTVMATHTEEDIAELGQALLDAKAALGTQN